MRKLIPMMLASLLVPVAGYSLGLGEIRLHSALNQPLSAEIDLLSVGAEDAASLSAGLASSDVFAQIGLDRNSTLLLINFEVTQRPDGSYVVKATSRQPIRDPYLDFLLEVNWKSGRALREYTVLLDPPELMNPSAVTVQPPAAAVAAPTEVPFEAPFGQAAAPVAGFSGDSPEKAEETAGDEGATAAESQDQAPAPAPDQAQVPDHAQSQSVDAPVAATVPAPAPAPVRSEVITYGPVKDNETLWSIAKRVRPDKSVTVPQVMAALVRDNPYAFYGKNANRMKAGHVLRLDPAQLAAISREEAAREIARQGREWQDYKQRAAAKAAARAPTSTPGSQESAAVAAAPKEEPRLKLVAPEESGKAAQEKAAAPGTGAKDADALRNELMLAIETSEAQKQENAELRKRMEELQGQLDSMQRLLSLKDDDMAALQRQAAQAGAKQEPAGAEAAAKPAPSEAKVAEAATQAKPSATPAPVKEASQAETVPPAAALAGAPAGAAATTSPDAVPAEAERAPAPAKEAKPAAKAKPAPKPKKVQPPPPAPEPSFLDGLFDNALFLGLAGFSAVIIAVAGLLVVRRRRSGGSFQESILMGGSPSMLKAKAAEGAHKEETSFFSDFAVSGMGDIHAEDSEVDPLTEADVYMAYQRYQQAEELLREAMKSRDRPELHVKLLEVFHATRDKEAFAAEAEKVNAMLSGKGPLWQKVLPLGHELLPQHPLFAQAPETSVAPNAIHSDARLDNEVLDIGLDLDALTEEMESGSTGPNEFNLDLGVDFSDLNDAGQSQPPAKPAKAPAKGQETRAPEFDLGSLALHMDEPAPATADASASTLDLGGLELNDLDLDALNAPADQGANGASTGGIELDAEGFDLGGLEFDTSPEAQPVAQGGMGESIELSDLENLQLADEELGRSDDDPMFANLDEAGTKLDLARAYMEMGDPEGARSILDEVAQEGNPAQKQQAQELLQQIA